MYFDSCHVCGLRILAYCPDLQAKLRPIEQKVDQNRQPECHENHRAKISERCGNINHLALFGHGVVSGYTQVNQPECHQSRGKKIDSHSSDELDPFEIGADQPEDQANGKPCHNPYQKTKNRSSDLSSESASHRTQKDYPLKANIEQTR